MVKEKIFYFDEKNNLIKDSDNAVKIIIREEDDDGEIIKETVLLKNKKEGD